ncbi:14799_t:CDS:2 [Funneliformis geosporum]|uniref:14799_t:CDS:1 n=1 Tax=Funneliformis geosporum TaxID=1117311 RepID=A0A9W4SBR4_9GLOM|nr:14799_t:CDS:2 [Funneliformis geosporum]
MLNDLKEINNTPLDEDNTEPMTDEVIVGNFMKAVTGGTDTTQPYRLFNAEVEKSVLKKLIQIYT